MATLVSELCKHEIVLLNRFTFHMACHECGEELAGPLGAAASPKPAAVPVAAPVHKPATSRNPTPMPSPSLGAQRCSHMLVSTHPVTGIVKCQLCSEILTKETYVDSRGVTKASAHDPANLFSAPQHLAAADFQADMADAGGASSYMAAFEGGVSAEEAAQSEWNPYSGAPCPHALKTTDVRTGKESCCMCRAEL
jgi:ribosomal protein S27E